MAERLHDGADCIQYWHPPSSRYMTAQDSHISRKFVVVLIRMSSSSGDGLSAVAISKTSYLVPAESYRGFYR